MRKYVSPRRLNRRTCSTTYNTRTSIRGNSKKMGITIATTSHVRSLPTLSSQTPGSHLRSFLDKFKRSIVKAGGVHSFKRDSITLKVTMKTHRSKTNRPFSICTISGFCKACFIWFNISFKFLHFHIGETISPCGIINKML